MRAAKERKRFANAQVWKTVRRVDVRDGDGRLLHEWIITAAPDGRHVGLEIDGRITIAGAERTIRGRLAHAIWGMRSETNERGRGNATGDTEAGDRGGCPGGGVAEGADGWPAETDRP